MSEAAAAFFANKKRKKKAFKFNANLVDVASINKTTHVDAPAISKDVETPQPQAPPAPAAPVVTDNEQEPEAITPAASRDDQQWEDGASAPRTKAAAPANNAGPEVRDMKSLAQGKNSDNIAEKLKMEETKAQLAAARQGMERQAAQAKAEKERKEQQAREKEAARAASTPMTNSSAVWVSARARAAQQSNLPKMRMGPGIASSQNLDTSNEELFPDLGSAGKILEQKSTQKVRAGKKTPVGGGASWAAKSTPKKAPAKPPMKRPEDAPKPKKKEEPKPVEPPAPAPVKETPAPAPAPAPAALPTVKPAVKAKKGKKKKKDLSTFKAGGS